MSVEEITDGVYKVDGRIATKNLNPGEEVYGEKLKKVKGEEYRFWNPYKSKPAAAFQKNLTDFPVKRGKKVLYLGVGDGTTASHLSDIVGEEGIIIGVDIAEKAFENFMDLCEKRDNIVPVLADANNPGIYSEYVPGENEEEGEVDVIYQDIAQREQTEILVKNIEKYLKDGGKFVLMVKARSIDVTRESKQIFEEEKEKLKRSGYKIKEFKELYPFEKGHAMIIGEK